MLSALAYPFYPPQVKEYAQKSEREEPHKTKEKYQNHNTKGGENKKPSVAESSKEKDWTQVRKMC